MSKLYAALRKQAQDLTYNDTRKFKPWKQAIMEAIFRPDYPSVPHKGPMDMLHPDIDKLHLPHGVYIADWRKYKVEDHLALVRFQERCHRAGLHDPWLRNDCFNFYENTGGGYKSRFAVIVRESLFGFVAASVFFVVQSIYLSYYPSKKEHTQEYIEQWGPEGRPSHH